MFADYCCRNVRLYCSSCAKVNRTIATRKRGICTMEGSKTNNLILLTVVTFTLLLNVTPSCGLRILGVFPVNGKSHFVMCESLMRGLAERGHQVDVYSHFPLKNPPANYTDYSLVGTVPQLMNNVSYEFIQKVGDRPSMRHMVEFGRVSYGLFELPVLQKLINDPPRYDLLITEPFMLNCFFAFGRHLNIPMINIMTTTLLDWLHEPLGSPVNYAVDPSIFAKFGNPMTFSERLENFVMSKFNSYSFNYYVREQDAVVEKYFGPGFPNVVELQKDISLVLLNYHPALNGIRTYSPNVIPVGGLHVSDSQGDLPKHVQKYLDEAKDGFIYVSFGSMVRIETFPKADIEAFYKTFQKIAPVRVLMKIAKPEVLPPDLPSNVITYHWLPQVKVLKHKNIKAFITHGGLMGTQESIYHGVPMIGFPIFGDQHFNIDSYVKRNMAIKLDRFNITEESLTQAVKEILKNPVYKKSAEIVGNKFRDVPMTPLDTAVFWVEYVARHGKDALRPPVVDLSWWQASLIDVYVFILSVIIVLLYIIKVIVKLIICMFSSKKSASCKEKVKKN